MIGQPKCRQTLVKNFAWKAQTHDKALPKPLPDPLLVPLPELLPEPVPKQKIHATSLHLIKIGFLGLT